MSFRDYIEAQGIVRPSSTQPLLQPALSQIFGAGPTKAERKWYDSSRDPKTFGTTLKLTPGQWARERAAVTSYRTGMVDVQRYGLQEEYQDFAEQKEPSTFSTLTTPIFDLLNGSLYSTAGFFRELVRSGDAGTAFRRAASELANALPGIDEEMVHSWGLPEPERTTYGDLLKDAGLGKMGSAVGGFVLDVLADPGNWIPGLNVMKWTGAGIKAGARGGTALALRTAAGRKTADVLGEAFKYGYKLDKTDVGARYRQLFESNRQLDETGREDFFRDVAESTLSDLGPTERALVGFFADDPRTLLTQVKELEQSGVYTPDQAAAIKDGWKYLHTQYKDIFAKETTATPHGVPPVLDPTMARRFYAFGTAPGTKRTEAVSQDFIEDLQNRGVVNPNAFVEAKETSPFARPPKTPTQSYGKTYQTLQERVQAAMSTEMDAGVQLVKRGLAHQSAMSTRRLIDSVISDPLISARVQADIPQSVQQGFAQAVQQRGLTGEVLNDLDKQIAPYGYKTFRFKRGKDDIVAAYALPMEITDDLTRVTQVFEDPTMAQKALKAFDSVQTLWKSWALFSPGYHSRNFQGGLFNNWIKGVGKNWGLDEGENFAAVHAKALMIAGKFEGTQQMPKWLRYGLNLTFGKRQAPIQKIAKPGGGFYTDAEIWQMAKEQGVVGQGLFAKDLPENYEQVLLRQMDYTKGPRLDKGALAASQADDVTKALLTAADQQAPMVTALEKWLGSNGAIIRGNRAVGTLVEDTLRLAHFMDRLHKKFSPAEAAMSTKKTHFDYTELTPFEKDWMKRLVPFYSWLRFNGPLQINALFEHPARYARFPKLIEEIEGMSSDWENIPTPDYFQELHAVRLPILRNDKPIYLNPNLPFQDLNKLNYRDVMGSLTPFVRVWFEQAPDRGYSIFMDREIEEYPGQAARVIPGVSRKTESVIGTLAPPVAKYGIRPARAIQRGELLEQAATELAGVKLIANDVRRTIRGQRLQKDEIMRQFRRKMREENRLPQ